MPLLSSPAVLLNTGAISIPAATATQSGPYAVTQIGYEITAQFSAPAGTVVPFVQVQLLWEDPASSLVVDTDTFTCPAATSPLKFTTVGKGPTKGSNLIVTLTNLDAAQPITATVLIRQHSRVATTDSWHWDNTLDAGVTVPGWTLPVLPSDESVLGMESAATVAAGATVAWLCGMHDGLVNFGLDLGGGAQTNLVAQVAAEPASAYVANNPIYGAVNPPANWQVACPRSPIRFQLHNNGTTAMNITWSAIRAS